MTRVFLSASIPLPERDVRFLNSLDVVLVREAIKSLVIALVERNGHLVFGGHPAITPLISMLFEGFGLEAADFVTLYQSDYFEGLFPAENERFARVVRVPAVGGDRRLSLHAMRERMLTDSRIDRGVFIGGMEGVIEEFEMFKRLYGLVRAMPIGSTGAAAQVILNENLEIPRSMGTDLTYLTLFRAEFSKSNEG